MSAVSCIGKSILKKCDMYIVSGGEEYRYIRYSHLYLPTRVRSVRDGYSSSFHRFWKMANRTISGLVAVFKVLFVASLAAPLLFFFNKVFIGVQHHIAYREIILVAGVASLFAIVAISYWLFRGLKDIQDPFFYGFALFCFTGVVDLIVGLEYDGKIAGFMGEYMKSGEPYLDSPYGGVICYLDTSILFSLELFMCYLIASRQNYRNVAIYWAAALFQSMMVLILGAFCGKHGLYPSTLLNTGHFIFPVVVGWSQILTAPNIKITGNAKLKSILKRPIDLLLVIISVISAVACFIRALTALKSPVWIATTYGKLVEPHLVDETPTPFLSTQVIIYMFYYMPLFLVSIYGLIKPGCLWLINVVLILGGALLHGQLSHILTSIHYKTPQQLKPPANPTSQEVFWAVNLTLLILPQLLVLRVVACPSFFASGKVVQKNKQQQKSPSESKQTKTKVSNKVPVISTKKPPIGFKKDTKKTSSNQLKKKQQ